MRAPWPCLLTALLLLPTSCSQRAPGADAVAEVSTSGEPERYTFEVTLRTTDTGCDHYADWWEVTSPDGQTLHYRRVLGHSHVDEQPFTRSGGPVPVDADESVVVRAHMNDEGYVREALRGSAQEGFEPITLERGFGAALAEQPPLPEGCAF